MGKEGRILRSETSFCIVPIIDKELLFTEDLSILLVHNISDREIARRDYEHCLREGIQPGVRPDEVEGKYAAFGMPGGGVAIERMDNRETAARNETKAETGLSVLNIRYLFTEGKTILRNSRTNKVIKQFFHKVGESPAIQVNWSRMEVIANPVHIFLARTEWEDTLLRNVMIKMRDRLIKDGELTKAEIKKRGVSFYFDELEEKEINSLDIEELYEIDGVAVVPLSHIQKLQGELRIQPRNKRLMYLSHSIWVDRAITKIEVEGV